MNDFHVHRRQPTLSSIVMQMENGIETTIVPEIPQPMTYPYSLNPLDPASTIPTRYIAQKTVDGVFIRVWNYNGDWHLSTRACVDAFNAFWQSDLSFGDLFLQAVTYKLGNEKTAFDWLEELLDKKWVYNFVLVHPEHTNVIHYDSPNIWLSSIQQINNNNNTVDIIGDIFIPSKSTTLYDCFPIEQIKDIKIQQIDDFKTDEDILDCLGKGIRGYMLYDVGTLDKSESLPDIMCRMGNGCFKLDHLWFKCIERIRDKWRCVEYAYISTQNEFDQNILRKWMPYYNNTFAYLDQGLIMLSHWCYSKSRQIPCAYIDSDENLLEFARKNKCYNIQELITRLRHIDAVTLYNWITLIQKKCT